MAYEPVKMRKGHRVCQCCGVAQPSSHFYPSVGIQFEEYVPYCIDCCDAKMQKYMEHTCEMAALYSLLGEVGIPFIKSVYEDVVATRDRGGPKPKVLGSYINKLAKIDDEEFMGFWDSDIDMRELIQKDEEKKVRRGEMDVEKMRRRWGNYPDDECVEIYQFLEDTYDSLTQEIYDMSANQQSVYMDLCKAKYLLRKSYESGDAQEIAKAQTNVQNIMKLLKIDNFQQEEKDERLKFIDRMAWIIEQTEPAEEEDKEKYRDIAGFEKSFSHIMRSLGNLLRGTKDFVDIPPEGRD